MATRTVCFFRNVDGSVPYLDWLKILPEKARDKCQVKLERLAEMGQNLRRPEADYLRDGIYELRIKLVRINYRILYFFHGRELAVVSHGLQKEKTVPAKEIELAIERRKSFSTNPEVHAERDESYHEEEEEEQSD